jgi:hypothetical protein
MSLRKSLRCFSHLDLYLIASVLSLGLSVWCVRSASLINPDGICYLYSANTYLTHGLHAAMGVCGQAGWPFYSVVIACISKMFSFSSITSAYLLNAILDLFTVLSFLSLVHLLGGTRKHLIFAAMTILLAHEFNGIREYIVRDHGYWVFYLISVASFILFLRDFKWRYALMWSISLCIGTLFRIEGAVFLLLLPFTVLIFPQLNYRQRLGGFFRLNSFVILVCAVSYVSFLRHTSLSDYGRAHEVVDQIRCGFDLIHVNFVRTASSLGTQVLSPFAARDAYVILFLMLSSWAVYSVINNVSWIYFCLFVYGAWQKPFVTRDALCVSAYLFINFLIVSSFMMNNMFISKRYLIALSLLLMLWVPFGLVDLTKRFAKKWQVSLLGLLIFISALGGIFDFGYSKYYIRLAGDWLLLHAAPSDTIYSNDETVLFYANKIDAKFLHERPDFNPSVLMLPGLAYKYKYIALRVNKEDKTEYLSFLKNVQVDLQQSFSNKRGDEIVIYKVLAEEKGI